VETLEAILYFLQLPLLEVAVVALATKTVKLVVQVVVLAKLTETLVVLAQQGKVLLGAIHHLVVVVLAVAVLGRLAQTEILVETLLVV
jgi:hypothetical protein